MGTVIEIANLNQTRLDLLKDFNLKARQGQNNWWRFINLASQAGFQDIDFRRIQVSRRMFEQWSNKAGYPPEDKREEFRTAIVATLQERLAKSDPAPTLQ